IGAGAHSKISSADRIVREVRWKQPKQYLAQVSEGAPLLEDTEVARDAVGVEFMLNALRLTEGVRASMFEERTGYPIAIVQRELAEGVRRGLLDPDPAVIRATALGRRFLNRLT